MACTVALCKAAQKDPVKKALAQQMLKELFSASVGKSAAKPEWHCKIASLTIGPVRTVAIAFFTSHSYNSEIAAYVAIVAQSSSV